MKKLSKYRRCKACKQLISARHEDCPNCAASNPLSMNGTRNIGHGAKGRPTLDVQERNRIE